MPDAPTLRFDAPLYPGGRHCLMCGIVMVGAAFPPSGRGDNWTWRVYTGAATFVWPVGQTPRTDGAAKTEESAKKAALAAFRAFLAAAGLEVRS